MSDAATKEAPVTEQQDTKQQTAPTEAPAKSDGFKFDAWLKQQPKEVVEALQSNERGLKSALDKTREEAEAAQKRLKQIERERQLADEQKLKDENRWKELAEQNEKRAKELQARLEAEEWTKSTRIKLKDEGLTDFEDVLLASRETPEDVAATGKRLSELINARVEAEVLKRLDTGKRPASQGQQLPKSWKDFDTSTPEGAKAYQDYIKAQGLYR